ncbi:uncharacterized protein C8Q71DRAFT_721210 [Rhodofomes roseus]|uniref:Uncharacterized protein n=1 Tax=Rhodofomes roseus TaxID=34475 RepID=A0ABQ8KQ19_9APHY|nr:uncharacterized protein C8Q71DRAFT_721210 [Rhodofomes roseus]KAH9840713.1 hypothetical protein C8Q71DRAFT_721210 [Rhodofomes roseus]
MEASDVSDACVDRNIYSTFSCSYISDKDSQTEGQQLHNELTLAQSGKKASKQLVTMAAADHLRASADVLNHGSGKDKLLVYGGQEDAVAEKMVLSIQGYLLKTKLPPITKESEHTTYPTKHIHSADQDPLFDQGAVAVLAIHQFLESRLGSGSLQDMDVKREQGHIVLDFHNRQVTDEVFTADNAVQFYERVKLDGSSCRMYAQIRLTGINQEHIQAALRKTSPTQRVKRNVCYEDDDSEVEEAREDTIHIIDSYIGIYMPGKVELNPRNNQTGLKPLHIWLVLQLFIFPMAHGAYEAPHILYGREVQPPKTLGTDIPGAAATGDKAATVMAPVTVLQMCHSSANNGCCVVNNQTILHSLMCSVWSEPWSATTLWKEAYGFLSEPINLMRIEADSFVSVIINLMLIETAAEGSIWLWVTAHQYDADRSI